MTTEPHASEPGPTDAPRPRLVVSLLLGVIVVVLVGWVAFGAYTGNEVRECTALYAAAHTAEDTTRVDLTVTPAAQKHAEPRSCGSMRIAGRWR